MSLCELVCDKCNLSNSLLVVIIQHDMLFGIVLGRSVDCGVLDWQSHVARVFYRHGSKLCVCEAEFAIQKFRVVHV